MSSLLPSTALVVVAIVLLTGCTQHASESTRDDGAVIEVTSSATDCTLSTTSASAGSLTFRVHNTGEEETEFYLYAEDGNRIVGEVEDVGPGLRRDLVVTVSAGSYVTACKPGMTGKGIRGTFTVAK